MYFFFLHVASLNNLVHELIIVHLLCGMYHNMDSQIEHKKAGMIRAHVQLNIDKKQNKGQTNESCQSNTSVWQNEMLVPPSICLIKWFN